jgi:hypothetical protein
MAVSNLPNGFVVTEGRQVDPKYETIRARQRSLKRAQVENVWLGRCYSCRRARAIS